MTEVKVRVGVDIGGTFTDIALEHQNGLSTCKVLTNYSQPEQAILEGIVKAAGQAGIALKDISQVIHGTTLVTNSLIERRGAKLAFITTEGFRDVVEMRSENRFEQYDLNLRLPMPLVARPDRFTLKERIAADGSVLLPLNLEEVESLAGRIVERDYEAVAIGFIHAYANGHHEREVERVLRAAAPHLSISLSSVVSPQMREFERFNTVIANAYVRPQVANYLSKLVQRLRETDIVAQVFMMHSGGGLISVETAADQPVRLLESGPAGGAIFAAEYANAHSIDKVLSFDMGGTTAKICLIEDGSPKTANSFEVARTYRFKKGSGMPVSTPVVEMVEIGAGGGSIAAVDTMGRIQVGPRSAASEPGPACYQRGGEEPTVTDANLLLGRLDPDNFAGGDIPLSISMAEHAIDRRLSSVAGVTQSEAAFGITEIVDENMANAARAHTVENGRDIEAFTMVAFGGGAPLHACRQCEKLGIDSVLIPPGAGVGSAIGFLRAPFSYEATRGFFQRLAEFNAEEVNAVLGQLEKEARSFISAGTNNATVAVKLVAFMRYSGQGWEIPVNLPHRNFTASDTALIKQAFESTYRKLFGRTIDGLEIEITNWSLTIATLLKPTAKVVRLTAEKMAPKLGTRRFYDAALRQMVEAAEIRRSDMAPGFGVAGPAIIIEDETSTIVTTAFAAIGQHDGSLLLVKKESADGQFRH
ncbi:MAG TPA: hydantoinase/oxoprolinase family protein [Xanthobacteraceae bacterium]|jgi:N-methylhydantoinase A|nr:hydantoinase/oxoprolinase family protein [Xanthobacteraceae bacterium]